MFANHKVFYRLLGFVLTALILIACSDHSNQKIMSASDVEGRKRFESALILAERGDAESQYLTAEFYEKGQDVAQDYQAAIDWYKKAAQQNHIQAQYTLGNLYKTGREKIISVDTPRAALWFQRAATQQYAPAQYELGRLYHYGAPDFEKNIQKAVSWYEKAAQNNHILAQYDLGLIYYVGQDLKKDVKQSVFWLKKAAENDHASAQWLLGKIYIEDNNVNSDPAKAFFLFEKAAKQGFADAQFELSQMYQKGLGVIQNEEKAKFWLDEAVKNNSVDALAERGDAFAQYLLGNSYLDGEKLFKTQSNEKAFYWFYQSARRGYGGAQYRLATMYQYGLGQKQDLNETRYWLDQAVNSFPMVDKAKQGDDCAQLLLGKVYALGTHTYKQNDAQAVKWFEKSAENGNAEAQYELALMYLQGVEGETKNDSALLWLHQSAHNGYEPAQTMLKKLNQPTL